MKAAVLILLLSSLSTDCLAEGDKFLRSFAGQSVSIEYDVRNYKKITETVSAEGSDAAKSGIAYDLSMERRRPLGGSYSDSGTICFGDLTTCTAQGGMPVSYWTDAQGQLRIADPTEPVQKAKVGERDVFEAFPLCGWEQNGVSAPRGGQCYAVVLPLAGKVVSFNFLLGKNTGCRQYEKCWSAQLRKVRDVASSAR